MIKKADLKLVALVMVAIYLMGWIYTNAGSNQIVAQSRAGYA